MKKVALLVNQLVELKEWSMGFHWAKRQVVEMVNLKEAC
jgi:hypothetical protein